MRHLRWLSAVLLTLTAWTVPAQASTEARGGWATTVIDPGTGRFTPGETQTISYWVLQHGTHPYDEGSFGHTLGETGLRLVDSNGTVTTFKGTPLPEPAHFSTSVTLPKTGSWDVYGIQGIFGFDKVGKLTVPGTLDLLPRKTLDKAATQQALTNWGKIHPPSFPAAPAEPGTGGITSIPASPLPEPAAAPAPASQPTTGKDSSPLVPWGAATAALAALALGALALRRRQQPTRQEPRELIG